MSRNPDFTRKKFSPLLDKTLKNALAHRLGQEFPRLGGPRILALCAELILEVVEQHLQPREHLRHGQALWLGVNINDPPSRGKRIADTDLVPLVLDLSTPEDINAILNRVPPAKRLLQKARRLCHQAYEQGALLGNCDLAELLTTPAERIGVILAEHERQTQTVVPRRATIHDVGSGLTHKRIICFKRYAQGKQPDQIARETYHSLEAVDHYLGQFDRVRHCLKQGLAFREIAYALNMSMGLLAEYVAIFEQLEAGHG
jgi:hypothetical protein